MTKHIRIRKQRERKPTFVERLESSAHALARRLDGSLMDAGPSFGLEREIALAVEHIDRIKRAHETLRRGLVRIECYIDTEIMQREPREPVYLDPRLPERDMLRARLLKIEQERRRLALAEEEKLQALHTQLLSLLTKHRHLSGDI